MDAAESRVRIEKRDGRTTLLLRGTWRVVSLPEVDAALDALTSAERIDVLDGAGLEALDTAGALALLRFVQSTGADPAKTPRENFTSKHLRILELVTASLEQVVAGRETRRPGIFAGIGRHATDIGGLLLGHLNYLGLTAAGLWQLLRNPRRLRIKELAAQFEQVGINAIPVVALVTLLIGVVFAYLLGLQAEKYGASIFVVDGVALGMAREFSPIIVAVIVAGRSGAAFTAQLGTMRLTEETDAIRVLGLSPMDVLVIPRLLALVVALPLLVFVGNIMGNIGAMFMADTMLGITPTTYFERLQTAVRVRHYVVGLVKAPVFAFFISIIAIRMGMTVSRDTRSIGINTTSTVVQSIVSVILLDAMFAIVFQKLGI
ncbi:MAG: ABC transporter permease [Burkholderiales bacterium]|jgi:phospholipid/cholesterol/gamma-HCH transport system permease protein|nr:ABC transporter permease [Burkholderiales bacterium]